MTPLLLALVLLAAPVEVEFAPDQPLNFIYVDDPLIVELRSDTDRVVTAEIEIAPDDGSPGFTRRFEDIALRAAAVRWLAIEDLPPRRGYYNAKVRIAGDGDARVETAAFCRIDRPRGEGRLPVYARNPNADPETVVALRHAGIHAVRFAAGSPTMTEDAAFFAERDFDVVARVAVSDLDGIDLAALAPLVTDWEVAAPNIQGIRRTVRAIRDAGSSGGMAVAVRDAAEFAALSSAGIGEILRETVVEGPDVGLRSLAEVRQAASAAGYEDWTVSAGRLSVAADTGLAIGLINHIGFGTRRIGIDPEDFVDGDLKPPYVQLHGLAQHLQGVQHAGTLALGDEVHAPVYRSGARWLVVLWTDSGERRIEMALPGVHRLALADGANNVLPAPEVVADVAQFTVGPEPRYLHGVGGEIVGRAAANKARNLARRFADDPVYREYLPASLLEYVRTAEKARENGLDRTVFFGMLREFPEIETRWHAGQLPRNVAAPALHDLAELVRALCAAEERSEEAFLEPLGDTLARCDDYMSIYITDSVSESHFRGDWLLDEVRRLADEAKRLDSEGRHIEASALGALAEWRARALEAAAKAGADSGRTAAVQVAAAEPETQMDDADGDAVSSTVVEQPEPPVVESPAPEAPMDAPAPAEADVDAVETAEDAQEPAAEEDDAAPEETAAAEEEAAETESESAEAIVHIVKSGENPSVIAARYNVKLRDLLTWNGLTARSRINIGDKLVVHPAGGAPRDPGQPAGTVKIVHVVARGDNPASIAKRYGVEQRDFERWNNLRHNTALASGKEYIVYVPAATMESGGNAATESLAPGQPAGTRKVTHSVARGDSPYTIARKYRVSLDDLLRWNKLTKRSVLQVGQKLTVYTK